MCVRGCDPPLCLQVILCTKEVSAGARKNAFVLLVEMGNAFIRFGPTPQGERLPRALIQTVRPMPGPDAGSFLAETGQEGCRARGEQLLSLSSLAEAMERFLLLVYAGLTGSVTMISCTVLALTRLFFEFKGEGGTCGVRGAAGPGTG